jgi:hypothetical protein
MAFSKNTVQSAALRRKPNALELMAGKNFGVEPPFSQRHLSPSLSSTSNISDAEGDQP